jgi:hypothetical protein
LCVWPPDDEPVELLDDDRVPEDVWLLDGVVWTGAA